MKIDLKKLENAIKKEHLRTDDLSNCYFVLKKQAHTCLDNLLYILQCSDTTAHYDAIYDMVGKENKYIEADLKRDYTIGAWEDKTDCFCYGLTIDGVKFIEKEIEENGNFRIWARAK